MTQELSADIHRLSHRLHPFKLDHLGLVPQLKPCLELSVHQQLEIKFWQQGFRKLPDEDACFPNRAGITSNGKHSGASSAGCRKKNAERCSAAYLITAVADIELAKRRKARADQYRARGHWVEKFYPLHCMRERRLTF